MALGLPLNFCTGVIEFDLISTPFVVTNKPRVTVAADGEKLAGWPKSFREQLAKPWRPVLSD